MDPNDIVTLNYRLDVSILYMLDGFVYAIGYGAACVVFGQALADLCRRIRSSTAVRVLFLIISLQLLLLTTAVVTVMVQYVTQLNGLHLYSTSTPVADQDVLHKSTIVAALMNQVAIVLTIPLGNALVVWRAWVLYSSTPVIRFFLVGLWLCDVGLNLAYMSMFIYYQVHSTTGSMAVILNRLTSVEAFLTFGVSATATASIAWKAWKHRLLVKTSGTMRNSRVVPILYILVEWGCTLCITQLALAILATIYIGGDVNSPGFIASVMLTDSLNVFAAVHPGLIVLVLAKGRSVIDNSTFIAMDHPKRDARQSRHGYLSTLRFAESEAQGQGGDASSLVDTAMVATGDVGKDERSSV